MTHRVAIKLGQAVGACIIAEQRINDLKGLSFNQETKDFVVAQLETAQKLILEVADELDKEDQK